MAGSREKVKSRKKLKVRRKNFDFNKGANKDFQSSSLATKNGENVCMVCGGETYDVHCKRICKNCGYMRDCSDP